jgi:hypothetical protein
MKKLFPLAILSALFIASCTQTTPKTPEDLAISFANALNTLDIDEAMKMVTESSKSQLDMKKIMSMDPDEKAKAAKSKKVEKASCEGDETQKKCKLCCDAEGSEMTLNLKKVGNEWKVDYAVMQIDDLMNDLEETVKKSLDSLDNTMNETLKGVDKISEDAKKEIEKMSNDAIKSVDHK